MAKRKRISKSVDQGKDPCDLNLYSDEVPFTWSIENIASSLLKDRYIQIIILLTIIGFLLRFYNIGFNSLWLDEAVTYHFASLPPVEIWKSLETGAEFNPPLFYFIESLMLYFGNSEVILRTIPALAGTFLIPVFYLLGKEFKDKNCGLICATLATFSVFLLFYSQEARAYTLALLFASLSILFFLKAINNNKWNYWVFCGFFSGLALWTHFYTAIIYGILILLDLYHIFSDKNNKREKIKNFGISILTFFVVTFPLLIVTIELFLKRTAAAPTYGFSGLDVITNALPYLAWGSIPITVILTVLFCIGTIWSFYKEKKKTVFLLFGILIILITSYFISFRMPFELRFLYIMIPFYFLGIAYSTGFFCRIVQKRVVIFVLIIGIALLHIPQISETYSVYTKENWRDFSREFENYTNDGDVVILLPAYLHYPFNYYYNNLIDNTTQFGASNIKELEEIVRENQEKRIFFILTPDIFAAEPSGESFEWLKNNATFMGRYTGIYLFKIPV